jgi:hypothetical protein
MKQAHLFSFLSSLLFLGVFADVAIHLIWWGLCRFKLRWSWRTTRPMPLLFGRTIPSSTESTKCENSFRTGWKLEW